MANWISVEEQLPHEDKTVLFCARGCVRCKEVCGMMAIKNVRFGSLRKLKGGYTFCVNSNKHENFCSDWEVTHWCEIPE